MASSIFRKFPNVVNKHKKVLKQPFDYLLVMDFEATCEPNRVIHPQEIIEIPCIALSTKDWKVQDVFHEYVKPRVHPQLTPFCTKLTGIIQSMVDDQPHFPKVFQKFCEWLDNNGYFKNDNKSAFVTSGDWDLKVMLPSQCALDNIVLPEHFKQWINLKHTFCDVTYQYPRRLTSMLLYFDLELEGQLHSGIDDAHNMVRIIQNLATKHEALFKVTSTLNQDKS